MWLNRKYKRCHGKRESDYGGDKEGGRAERCDRLKHKTRGRRWTLKADNQGNEFLALK